MILWGNIDFFTFYYFDFDPRFHPFYYMLGGNLGSLLYGDVSVMIGVKGPYITLTRLCNDNVNCNF